MKSPRHARAAFWSRPAAKSALIRATLCLVYIFDSACGEIRAQSLQKLLESAGGAAPGKKAQPSATEQNDWASGKLLEFQAKAKALNVQVLREELRKANLPETRVDEFLSASQETVRNYQAAVDTLSAIISKESERISSAPPESLPLPKDDAEVDTLREKLAALRTQAQTATAQVNLDEESLARQQSALKAAGQQLRRAQEEFDAADTDAARNRAALQLKLAEIQQEAASSAVFLASWRLACGSG